MKRKTMMSKRDLFRQMWLKCLGLINRGRADEMMDNPAKDFVAEVKNGAYDDVDDLEYEEVQDSYTQLVNGIWHKMPQMRAWDVLFNALKRTKISAEQMAKLADLLSECSDGTDDLAGADEAEARTGAAPALRKLGDLTPKGIESYLHGEGGIVGQDAAVRAAAMILHNHVENRPSVSLFCGPTGSGKTQIWRALQKPMESTNVRIVIHDASSLTAEGWRGGNKISTIFKSMDNQDQREHIILVLDEFDKLIEPQYTGSGNNYSDLVQNQLLKLFDHDTLFFGDESGKGENLSVDTSHISVVLLGAFQRLLENKTNKSETPGSIGFGNQLKQPVQKLNYSNTEITTEDLVESGMREEIAGRITRITCMEPLSVEDMVRIGQLETSRLATLMGAEVVVGSDTLMDLSHKAQEKGLGARWLKHRLSNLLDNLIYEDPFAERYCLDYPPAAKEPLAG